MNTTTQQPSAESAELYSATRAGYGHYSIVIRVRYDNGDVLDHAYTSTDARLFDEYKDEDTREQAKKSYIDYALDNMWINKSESFTYSI